MTKTTGNFTDFVSFSRASGGTALRRISYGNELVTNGTFDTDTGWTKGTGWTISGGVATAAGGTSDTFYLEQNIGLVAGKVYQYEFTTSGPLGGTNYFAVRFGGASDTFSVTQAKSYSGVVVASGSGNLRIRSEASTSDITIDNISVKEVLFDRADGTLQLFNHPTNVPRVEYDASGNLKGLLIEEARTNLVTYSQTFTSWASSNSPTVTANAATSPDGSTNATALLANGTGGFQQVTLLQTLSDSTDYCFSIYFKAAVGNSGIRLALTGKDGLTRYFGALSDGSPSTPSGATNVAINTLGNGWHRLSGVLNSYSGAAAPTVRIYMTDSTGGVNTMVSGDGIYIYGAQLEAGAFPTSYIPTTGATATRAADICSIATSAFGYNQGAGTIVVDVAEFKFGTSGFPRAVEIGNSSNNGERINVVVGAASGTYSAGLNTANVFQMGGTLASSVSSPFVPSKAALAYKTNDGAAAYGGVIKITDTSIDVVGTSYPRNTLKIGGSTVATTDQINGHIKSIAYYPRRLTNAQLQALTA